MTRTIIKSEIIDKTSVVTIGTELGQFSASVTCQPEDYDYFSNYHGCHLAELKATMKYFKYKKNLIKAQMTALDHFYSSMKNTRTFDGNAYYVKQLAAHYSRLSQQVQECTHSIKKLQEAYHACIVAHDEHNKKVKFN